MSIFVIVALLLATLTFVVVGVGVLVAERSRRATLAFSVSQGRTSRIRRLRARLERALQRTRRGRWLRRTLDKADLGWPLADTVVLGTLALLVTGWVTYQIGGPFFAAIMLGLLLAGARAWFRRREEKRFAKFIDQLPDLARLLANAADAGLSLRAAISIAAQESVEPTRGELARVTEELALGSSLEDAMDRMGRRLPSRELAVLVNVLIIQARAGGRIVTALRGITEALETRRDVRREVATLIAGSKATVYAVSFLGAGMVLLVHNSVDGGLRALLANPIGLAIFVVSLTMFIVGMLLIRRATAVDV
jgi:tight adherence protein B